MVKRVVKRVEVVEEAEEKEEEEDEKQQQQREEMNGRCRRNTFEVSESPGW